MMLDLFRSSPFDSLYMTRDSYEQREDGDLVTIEMPGVSKKDVELSAANRILTVKAKTDKRSYYKSYTLSRRYDVEGIRARMENGMLEIFIPFAPKEKAQLIPIE